MLVYLPNKETTAVPHTDLGPLPTPATLVLFSTPWIECCHLYSRLGRVRNLAIFIWLLWTRQGHQLIRGFPSRTVALRKASRAELFLSGDFSLCSWAQVSWLESWTWCIKQSDSKRSLLLTEKAHFSWSPVMNPIVPGTSLFQWTAFHRAALRNDRYRGRLPWRNLYWSVCFLDYFP